MSIVICCLRHSDTSTATCESPHSFFFVNNRGTNAALWEAEERPGDPLCRWYAKVRTRNPVTNRKLGTLGTLTQQYVRQVAESTPT